MLTNKFADFVDQARAKCPSVGEYEGILYFCKRKSAWFLLHNNPDAGGGEPDGFSTVKKKYGFNHSWHIGYSEDGELASYKVELLDSREEPEPAATIDKYIKMKSSFHGMRIRATRSRSITAEGIAYYCPDDRKWYFLSDNSDFGGDAPHNWPKVQTEYGVKHSWFFSNGSDGNIQLDHMDSFDIIGAVPAKKKDKPEDKSHLFHEVKSSMHGAKVRLTYDGNSIEGILYQCPETELFFVLHNDKHKFDGGTPEKWSTVVKSKYGVSYGWNIASKSGILDAHSADTIEILADAPREKEPEQKFVKLDYSSMEEGAEVLFAVGGSSPEHALPTRGKLVRDRDYWYILHNDMYKNGAGPVESLSTFFDGEFSYSWLIENASCPYGNLIRFEILSRPAKKTVIVDDKFAVGQVITSLTKEQFTDKLGRTSFQYNGEQDKYYGRKATVRETSSTDYLEIKWEDGPNYTMSKTEFREYYNDLDTIYIHGAGKIHTIESMKSDVKYDPITFEAIKTIKYADTFAAQKFVETIDSDGYYRKEPLKDYEARIKRSEARKSERKEETWSEPWSKRKDKMMKATSEDIDPLSKSEYIRPARMSDRCSVKPTSDWQVEGDPVPRSKKIDTLLILGL